ncbi:MAG: hypothetical protein ACPGO3_11515 [Magnetospiraceae bacterium]
MRSQVEITFKSGVVVTGSFFLKRYQRMTDLLNDERVFLPFEDESGAVTMISKDFIALVKSLESDRDKDFINQPINA